MNWPGDERWRRSYELHNPELLYPMTEKEKMLEGQAYNSRDPELLGLYHRARKLLKTYNDLDSNLTTERDEILAELFSFKGEGVWIESPFFL